MVTGQLPSSPPVKKLRFDFLDGLRGLSALYVVLFHIGRAEHLPSSLSFMTAWMAHGNTAVAVFIVLSGFCLMLPCVSTGLTRKDFFYRRARRILPPYYAALVITLILILISSARKQALSSPDTGMSVFNPMNILSHIFLFHNLSPNWSQSIDPPMWSVATEWQIYFIMPFILLPIWKRYGNSVCILAGFAMGLAPLYLIPANYHFYWASSWFIGLFACGMAGAVISISEQPSRIAWKTRLPYLWLSFISLIICMYISQVRLHILLSPWLLDACIGVTSVFFILACVQAKCRVGNKTAPLYLRICSHSLSRRLGDISYSLYLMHMPFWWGLDFILKRLSLSPVLEEFARLFVCLPIIILLCYGFHLIFEKRFMNR